ncbi:MAG: toll/interleukin-1 receptor domain-containing protein [Pseudomonadota bacterium]|nr:toll/interleukin-1 receptor domain-containing protein [Pseudomonadota bacterium]
MAFVPSYDHDVFVSYAHIDNQGETAWVSTLLRHLDTDLRQRLGTKDLRIWIDKDLSGNRPLSPEIMRSIQRSATLLVVMSSGYLTSEWCAKERNAFLGFARDCVAEGRIFIVHCRETDRTAIPAEFGDLIGFKFWTQDPEAGGATRPLGLPGVKEHAYLAGVINLSDRLARTLAEVKAARKPEARSAAEYVFLARSTDDLETREEELVGYLTQAGLRILPESWYPDANEHEFRAVMEADLNRCSVFVQLLSSAHGRKASFAGGQRYPAIQHHIARSSGKPVLQWRDPNDDPAAITDGGHRAVVEGARACGFEEFKRAVVEAARRKLPVPKTRMPQVSVFVNADREDLDVARQLSALLAKQGVECYWPLLEGSAEKVRQDLEESLKECDGLVLIYGASEPAWVRDQLRQGRKILSQRERALAALAIYLSPPDEKQELAVALPELITLDGRAGVNAEALHPFVQRLTAQG